VLGEIPILASEQRLLDGANGGDEPDGDASRKNEKKPKEAGGRGSLQMGRMPAYTKTTTTKPPLRSMLPPCFRVILWLLTITSLRQRLSHPLFMKFS